MRKLHEIKNHDKANDKYMNALNYHVGMRDFMTVKALLKHTGSFGLSSELQDSLKNLFLINPKCNEYFGIGANIIGSMSNMVFGGQVNIKTKEEKIQKDIDEMIKDGYFMDSIKEAYETALTDKNGIAYLFINTVAEYDVLTQVKVRDEYIDLDVVPHFEIEHKRNVLERVFYKNVIVEDKKKEVDVFKFIYRYETDSKTGHTELNVFGFDKDDTPITSERTIKILEIDDTYEFYDFIPYVKLSVNKGMLPNIIHIEDSLAENIYFQDEDLPNSQTQTYTPDDMLEEVYISNTKSEGLYGDRYKTRHIVKQGIEGSGIVSVAGNSAITTIEKHMALNIMQASLDAKISPVSLGYSLIDKIASNTDVGVQKERVSIRLRENHIARLKIAIAVTLQKRFALDGIEVNIEDISVLFGQYITPSIESLTNVLSKQVQFGIKSRKKASQELNENELSDKEIEAEYELIKELGTQIDYNVDQRGQAKKGQNNNISNGENE